MFRSVIIGSLRRLAHSSNADTMRAQRSIRDIIRALSNDEVIDFQASFHALRETLAHMNRRNPFFDLFVGGGSKKLLDTVATLITISEARRNPNILPGELNWMLAPTSCSTLDELAGDALAYVLAQVEDRNLDSLVVANVRRYAISLAAEREPNVDGRANCNGLMRFPEDVPILGGLVVSYAFARGSQVPRVLKKTIGRFSGANLRAVDLRGADLSGADLQNANLSNAQMSHINLERANLEGANLSGADLKYGNLRYANLQRAILDAVNLGAAALQGANLVGAELRPIYIESGGLSGVNLDCIESLWELDCRGAVLQLEPKDAAELWLKGFFDRETNPGFIDRRFNHRNNDGRSVLQNIAGLDDSCRPQKVALMTALVGRLDAICRTDNAQSVINLVPSLGDVIFLDPEYLQGYDEFADWLLDGLLGDGSALLDVKMSASVLKELGDHAARLLKRQDLGEAARRSVAIFQVLHKMRGLARSDALTVKERQGWGNQADTLHQQYCTVLSEKLPSLMDNNGVYASERAVLYDDDAFPLLSADARSCVILTDAQYKQLVLGDRPSVCSEVQYSWDDLRCVRAVADGSYPANALGSGEGGTRGTAKTVPVLEQFPLLRSARLRDGAVDTLGRMLALSGLDGPLLNRFTAALKQRHTRDRLTGVEEQLEISKVFKNKYEEREGRQVHLAAVHLAELKAFWPGEANMVFAFRLLCMGALYTNYASSLVFGTETESPNALRFYAMALLLKAHELAPELLSDAACEDWTNRLIGNSGAFTCTSVLYSTQTVHLNRLVNNEMGENAWPMRQIRDEMIPLAWR